VWSKVDLKQLLSRIKKSIPGRDAGRVYSRTQRALDWGQVAFSSYSPEQCQAKWKQMFDKVRNAGGVHMGMGASSGPGTPPPPTTLTIGIRKW